MEFLSISRVINHMTCYKFEYSTCLKLQHSDWRVNLVKDFFLNKFSTNESTQIQVMWFITRLIQTNFNWKPPSSFKSAAVLIGIFQEFLWILRFSPQQILKNFPFITWHHFFLSKNAAALSVWVLDQLFSIGILIGFFL